MLNPKAKLVQQPFGKVSKKATRDGYGEGLVEAGASDKNVVVLCCDLTESTRSSMFKSAYPDRFVQVGVSEQAAVGIAAGMALSGKVPFVSSFAAFSPGRNWEQIRTLLGIQKSNVKIAGSHAGVSVGKDGATHQALEDIATMRVIPNMTVIVPCDVHETRKATVAAAKHEGPVYLRFARPATPVFTTTNTPFQIGRAEVYKKGRDVAIIASGPILHEALKAAKELAKKKIDARVINCHTIKPLDEKTISLAAKECKAIVTCEDAQVAGGLGGTIAEFLGENYPVPLERVGIKDRNGESGTAEELSEHHELTAPAIIKAAIRAMKRKK